MQTKQPINLTPPDSIKAAVHSDRFKLDFKNGSGDEPAEILVYGDIGEPSSWGMGGVSASDMGNFLRANRGKAVNVRINSPGGLAYDGVTIHNALLTHDAAVTTTIEGIAGSSASIIAMAGQPVRMFENASLFIHRAWGLSIGNTDVMRDAADFLDKLDDSIARTYGAKAGKPRAQFMTLMRGKVDGTVLTAAEAHRLGLVDEVLGIGAREGAAASAAAGAKTPLTPEAAAAAARTALNSEGAARLQHVDAEQARRLRERR